MQAFLGILETHVPEAFPAIRPHDREDELVEHPALSAYYQHNLTTEFLRRAIGAVPRPEPFAISVPFSCKSSDVWTHVRRQAVDHPTGNAMQYLRAAKFFFAATAACHPQLIQEIQANGDLWVPCVMRHEVPLERTAPTTVRLSLSFQTSATSIGHHSLFSVMEGDAVWLHLHAPLEIGQQLSATNGWSITKQQALCALACRWRSVSYYASEGTHDDQEAARQTCSSIQSHIEEMLPTPHDSRGSAQSASLALCSGQLSDEIVGEVSAEAARAPRSSIPVPEEV